MFKINFVILLIISFIPISTKVISQEINSVNIQELLLDIIDPNESIVPGYASERFVMNDEEEYSGVVLEENDKRILIRQGDGSSLSVAKNMLQQRFATLSPMPEGIASALNHRELRDLMAYLKSL